MHPDGGRIQAHGLDADAHDLLALQLLEDLIQHAALGPAVHAGVDGMPISKAFGQSAPLAAMLGHIEQDIQQLQVVQPHVAALAGKTAGNTLVLRLGDLHAPQPNTELRFGKCLVKVHRVLTWFAIPLADWLRSTLRAWAESLIHAIALPEEKPAQSTGCRIALDGFACGPDRTYGRALVFVNRSGMAGIAKDLFSANRSSEGIVIAEFPNQFVSVYS